MRTKVILIASVTAAGCSFSSSNKPADAQAGIDSSHDAPPDSTIDAAPDAPQQDFGTGVWTVHVPTLPTSGVTLSGNVDTSASSTDCMTTAMWADPSQPDSCFIVGTTINTGANVNVRGPRPLVLVATDAITIDKNIDVASHRSQAAGPGADWSGCGSPTAGANRATGGGGGAGGTYITVGGSGGQGDNAQSGAGVAVNTVLPAPTILHGGCPGSSGGTASATTAIAGASGGGAIYVVAGHTITIPGLINASGAGPVNGGHATGGAGAGSGGTIVLYAPMITATTGKLMANGGGGGGGGDNNSNGTNGNDAMIAMPLMQAPGGAGPNDIHGSGGAGYSATAGAGAGIGGNAGEGGGGGGGASGYIRSNVTLTGAIASPAVDVVP